MIRGIGAIQIKIHLFYLRIHRKYILNPEFDSLRISILRDMKTNLVNRITDVTNFYCA